MCHIFKCCVALLMVCALTSCESPRTLELSVPLAHTQPIEPSEQTEDTAVSIITINPLDVLVAVETVAADHGLRPWIDPLDNNDLLGLADEVPSMTASQTWRHPDFPVYLSATRHKNEILLLLNWPSDAEPDPKARALFGAVRSQLLEAMSPFLHPAPKPQEQTK